MQIYRILPHEFGSNAYLVTEDGVNAVAIDPAGPSVLTEAAKLGLTVRYVLLTHGHFDHIGGCASMQAAKAKIGCCKGEEKLIKEGGLGARFGAYVHPFSVDFTFCGGETLSLCGMRFEVISTPGHTAGSCCFALREGERLSALFTGDTLFRRDAGRTDLPTGSEKDLKESLLRLAALDGSPAVYPGHGEKSELAQERAFNPYLR